VSKTIHTQAVQPTRHHINVPGQLLKLIPRSLIHHAAKETGNEAKARTIAVFGLTPPLRKQPLQRQPRPRCQVCRAGLLAHPCPRSVCGLCRARRDIEVFFKQVKQALKPGDFLGHDANAIRRQV